MDEHEPFIAAIEAQPDDRTARLVYADWLDERAHPAGEYLRAELHLASLPDGSAAANLRAKLRTLRPRIEPEWLARFDQPRVMLANPTPFPAAWWCVNLPGVRDFRGTYRQFAYETLPPLRTPRFTGAFDWLPKGRTHSDDGGYAQHLRRLTQHLSTFGLIAPPDFARWLTDTSLWNVPSCTGCGPARSWDTAVVDGHTGARVLPFYVDSQGCITWYLYMTPDGYSAVVGGNEVLYHSWFFTARHSPDRPLDNLTPPEVPIVLAFAAPSVEAFLYRWRFENVLWHKLVSPELDFYDPTPLTSEEQAYLDFYRRHPAIGT